MSFSLIPPEINSALMFSGAGSGPLLEAATAWDGLAADLDSTATQYQTADHQSDHRPVAGAVVGADGRGDRPLHRMAARHLGHRRPDRGPGQVAAAAYQSAYASMVPLPEIAANRALLASWSPTTSWAKTPGRSPPPRPITWTCGSRTR